MIPFSFFYVYISSTSSRPSSRSVSQHLSVASIDSVMTADGRKLIVSGGASFFPCGVWLNILSNLFRAAAADPYLGMCILPVMKNELVKCLVVEGRSKHQGCLCRWVWSNYSKCSFEKLFGRYSVFLWSYCLILDLFQRCKRNPLLNYAILKVDMLPLTNTAVIFVWTGLVYRTIIFIFVTYFYIQCFLRCFLHARGVAGII